MHGSVRRSLVLGAILVLAGLGCGQAADSTGQDLLEPAGGTTTSEGAAAHIVCSAEDPCPKGTVCFRKIACVPTCKTTADCAAGKTCTAYGSSKICL
ncbi:MAG TPA: hypothetical protein VK454_11920 [Myxococcaceae bacterium]|nr:hypothetical protein [Myxococcaceae bacterium]